MEYKMLGKSDLNISRIGFGCMSLDPLNTEAENILQKALDGGMNYFDTADMYHKGQNETMLGNAFSGKRDRVIIATKVGNQWRPDGSGWDWNPSKKYILASVDQSLTRLQTDYIDLYQLHGGTINDPIEDVIDAFESLVASGKIRYYGISSIRPNVIREYVNRSAITSNMMQYSLLDRRPEEEMLEFLNVNQIGVLARGTIAKGMLVSKTAESYLGYSAEEVALVAAGVESAADHTYSKLEIATQYVLHHKAITSAIIGIRSEQQLKEALEVKLSARTDDYQMKKLRDILPANKYSEHR
jgi:aryl-alcohol dehydrogenase-like predicted oxidoreductase